LLLILVFSIGGYLIFVARVTIGLLSFPIEFKAGKEK